MTAGNSTHNGKGIAVNPTTNEIYVTNDNPDTISVIDGKTNKQIRLINLCNDNNQCKEPEGVAVNPTTNLVYVTNYLTKTISVIDGRTNSVLNNTIAVGAGPYGIAVNPNKNMIYVTNLISNTISVIDGKTNNVLLTAPGNLPLEVC